MDVESSFLTRNQTQVPCFGSVESQPVDHQGSPWFVSWGTWVKKNQPLGTEEAPRTFHLVAGLPTVQTRK